MCVVGFVVVVVLVVVVVFVVVVVVVVVPSAVDVMRTIDHLKQKTHCHDVTLISYKVCYNNRHWGIYQF